MMNPRSIRFRLTAAYAAILAVTFAIVGIGAWVALTQSIQKTADVELRSRLQVLRTYIAEQSIGSDMSHLASELEEEASVGPGDSHIRVADFSRHWLYRSPSTMNWGFDLPQPAELTQKGRIQTRVIHGQPFRVLSASVSVGILQIGFPLDEFNEMLQDFTWTIALGTPLLLLFASAGGYWMSGRALRPVDQIARSAKRISIQNLSERLPATGTGDELDRLSATLNGMLAGLEAAFAKITQFTADASHELRTPIAIMRTTAEVTLAKPRSQEDHARAWGLIINQAERTSQLIDALLLLARSDSGSASLPAQAMNLAVNLHEACSEMELIAEDAGLSLRMSALADCELIADPEALRRMIVILLDNAIKFTKPGGAIQVSSSIEDRGEHRTAIVSVRDTGVGISEEDLPHVFDRFYRAAKDRARITGGAGLGLSIAQSLAARHGGKIVVESTLGKGSTFFVHLPMS